MGQDLVVLMEQLDAYYHDFDTKVALFTQLKDTLVDVESRLFVTREKSYKDLTIAQIRSLQEAVDNALDQLAAELERIKPLLESSIDELREERSYSSELVSALRGRLSSVDLKGHARKKIRASLTFLEGDVEKRTNNFGLNHVLASQLDLLDDIHRSRKDIKHDLARHPRNKAYHRRRLARHLRVLKLEIVRFGQYIREEARLIGHKKSRMKKFETTYNDLRSYGLPYSEERLTPYNIGIATQRFGGFYGAKGVGVIHKDGAVQIRFVRGGRERHAEVLRFLMRGIPGRRLKDDELIYAYLRSLPLEDITRVCGFELQLLFDKNTNSFEVVNIDYSSTILEVLVERKIKGEFVRIRKRDFERLNYALLYSIHPKLVDNKEYRMRVTKTNNRIKVEERMIYPLRGALPGERGS